MGQIKVYFSAVKTANTDLNKVASRLDALAGDVELLRERLDFQIRARYQIDADLISCRTSALTAYTRIKKLLNVVDNGLEKYQAAEFQLNRIVPNGSKVRG